MLLSKISPGFLFTIFLLFSNFWIYRIFKENFLLGIVLISVTLLMRIFLEKKDSFKIFLACALLLAFQYTATQSQSLTLLENDEQRVQQERSRSYPPTYIDLYFKVIWFKPAEWIEKNNLVIGLSRIEKNLFENLDINKYFFGGSPRNSPQDFEKFTFFLLPLFLAGAYKIVSDKMFNFLLLVFVMPLIFLSIVGNKNNLGAFAFFPFFILTFTHGINFLYKIIRNRKILYVGLISAIILGFVLQISYAKI